MSYNAGDKVEDGMPKGKLSATVDGPLLEFLDSLPGKTRSERLERVLAIFQRLTEERQLRTELSDYWGSESDEERAERAAWELTVAEAMWTE